MEYQFRVGDIFLEKRNSHVLCVVEIGSVRFGKIQMLTVRDMNSQKEFPYKKRDIRRMIEYKLWTYFPVEKDITDS